MLPYWGAVILLLVPLPALRLHRAADEDHLALSTNSSSSDASNAAASSSEDSEEGESSLAQLTEDIGETVERLTTRRRECASQEAEFVHTLQNAERRIASLEGRLAEAVANQEAGEAQKESGEKAQEETKAEEEGEGSVESGVAKAKQTGESEDGEEEDVCEELAVAERRLEKLEEEEKEHADVWGQLRGSCVSGKKPTCCGSC